MDFNNLYFALQQNNVKYLTTLCRTMSPEKFEDHFKKAKWHIDETFFSVLSKMDFNIIKKYAYHFPKRFEYHLLLEIRPDNNYFEMVQLYGHDVVNLTLYATLVDHTINMIDDRISNLLLKNSRNSSGCVYHMIKRGLLKKYSFNQTFVPELPILNLLFDKSEEFLVLFKLMDYNKSEDFQILAQLFGYYSDHIQYTDYVEIMNKLPFEKQLILSESLLKADWVGQFSEMRDYYFYIVHFDIGAYISNGLPIHNDLSIKKLKRIRNTLGDEVDHDLEKRGLYEID